MHIVGWVKIQYLPLMKSRTQDLSFKVKIETLGQLILIFWSKEKSDYGVGGATPVYENFNNRFFFMKY